MYRLSRAQGLGAYGEKTGEKNGSGTMKRGKCWGLEEFKWKERARLEMRSRYGLPRYYSTRL